MPANNVNDKQGIKKAEPRYYHCFRLNQNNYAIFDIKMDMPILIGSVAIVKSMKLPDGAVVFSYKIGRDGYFEKTPQKYVEVKGDGKHQKPPLRYHIIHPHKIIYHHFKLSPIVCVIFDDEFDMPIAYGSNQKIQGVINNVNKNSKILYYQEDKGLKNSFKWYMTYDPTKA
jgi:hypothetical protein